MQSKIREQLERLRNTLAEGAESDSVHDSEAGEGGAENVSDVNDNFYAYFEGLVDSILAEYEMSEEDAVDAIFSVADSLAADGTLPEVPAEDDHVATAEWLGKAKSMLFGEMVLAALEASVEEESAEE
jgi:hypothetical protein